MLFFPSCVKILQLRFFTKYWNIIYTRLQGIERSMRYSKQQGKHIFYIKANFPSCSIYPQSWVNSAMCLTSYDLDMPSFAGVNITFSRLEALAKLAFPASAEFAVLFCSLLLICFQPFLSLLFTSSKNFAFSLSPPLWPSYCLMSLSSTQRTYQSSSEKFSFSTFSMTSGDPHLYLFLFRLRTSCLRLTLLLFSYFK